MVLILFRALGNRRGFPGGTVASQVRHPPNILVDVVRAHHVHNFAGILLRVLILKLVREGFVCLIEGRLGLLVLVAGREALWSW